MQTFLPYESFSESAAVLDRQRLGKQRVETLQIVGGITGVKLVTSYQEDTGMKRLEAHDDVIYEVPVLRTVVLPKDEWRLVPREGKTSWGNHPVSKMWEGHEFSLMTYQRAICNEWTSRGYKDTCLEKTEFLLDHAFPAMFDRNRRRSNPSWLGNEQFHAAHRSNLLRKDWVWYNKFGWTEPDDLEYIYPV